MIDSVFHAGKKRQETKQQAQKTTSTTKSTTITTGATITPNTQTKKTTKVDPLAPKDDPLATPTQSAVPKNDPLTSFQAPKESPSAQSPIQPQNQPTESMPDWLKPADQGLSTKPKADQNTKENTTINVSEEKKESIETSSTPVQ